MTEFYKNFPNYDDDSDYNTNANSYYKDLGRKTKLIKLLAKRIWEYDNTLNETLEQIEQRLTDYITKNDDLMNERLENWDKRIDEMPEEMRSLFIEWLNDGTLEQIINDDVLGNKADKTYVDENFTETNDDISSLNSEVNRRIKTINQTDFSNLHKSKNYTHAGLIKRDEQNIELFAQNNTEGVRYLLTKDTNDDFFKLGLGGFYKNTTTATIETHGTGWETDSSSFYTTQVGDTFTIEYEGTGIELKHLADERGGKWDLKFESEVKTITTFNETLSEYYKPIDFFHEYGKKKVTGVFVGSDPASNYETPRGWIQEDVLIYGTIERNELIELLHPSSNKEFAFNIQYEDEPSLWHPEHNNLGTMYNHQFLAYVDGEGLNFPRLPVNEPVIGHNVSLTQITDGFNNSGEIVLANYRIQHNIDLDGLIDFKGFITAKQPFILTTGYPLMLPVNHETLTRVVTSYGNRKKNDGDGSQYSFTDENGELTSVAFTSNISGYGSYFAFATLDEATKSMRYGQDGTPPLPNATFFWQRDIVPKFYFQSFDNKQFSVDDEYRWSGKIGVGHSTQLSYYM